MELMWRRLADWCLPAGTFPRYLTHGDDPAGPLFGGRWLNEVETEWVLGRPGQQTCSSYEWKQAREAWADRRFRHAVLHASALLLYEIDAVLYRAGRWLGVNR